GVAPGAVRTWADHQLPVAPDRLRAVPAQLGNGFPGRRDGTVRGGGSTHRHPRPRRVRRVELVAGPRWRRRSSAPGRNSALRRRTALPDRVAVVLELGNGTGLRAAVEATGHVLG